MRSTSDGVRGSDSEGDKTNIRASKIVDFPLPLSPVIVLKEDEKFSRVTVPG